MVTFPQLDTKLIAQFAVIHEQAEEHYRLLATHTCHDIGAFVGLREWADEIEQQLLMRGTYRSAAVVLLAKFRLKRDG